MQPAHLPFIAALASAPLTAQWSDTATTNLLVADGASAQVQPKIAPTADGGCYVSFYDSDPGGSPAFGYDVRLQRLDAAGNELWAHGGVLVADRGFSSTQDYGLAVDPATGDALLAFRDDRPGGTQISAARFDAAGTALWGAAGVQLTSTSNFVAAPKIDATTDGSAVVAWTENADVRVRKLLPNGTPAWPQDTVISPTVGTYSVSDLHAADNGSAIVAIVHGTGGFSSPRHLRAQKVDTNGGQAWGAVPPAVFDGGSLQFGNFPSFVPDGSGGAVFGWYSSSPALEASAQRLDASGVEAFPHNGVTASTDATKTRVNPSVCFDPATQETTLVYIEQNASQSMDIVAAQRFDFFGARTWSTTGTAVTTPGSAALIGVGGALTDGGFTAFWIAEPSFGMDQVSGARIDASGTVAVAPFAVSSSPSGKGRLQVAASDYGFALVAWNDDGAGSDDIAVQNALPNGTLGGVASATVRNGTGVNPLCYAVVSAPRLGGQWTSTVTHSASTTLTATFIHAQPGTGPIVPGIGEALVDFGSPFIYSNTVFSSGTVDTHTLGVPINTGIIGLSFPSQALIAEGFVLTLCNAIDIRVGL